MGNVFLDMLSDGGDKRELCNRGEQDRYCETFGRGDKSLFISRPHLHLSEREGNADHLRKSWPGQIPTTDLACKPTEKGERMRDCIGHHRTPM